MRTIHFRRVSLGVLTAALMLTGTAIAIPSDVVAAPAVTSVDDGVQYLNTVVNLPDGVWTTTPLAVHLPEAGTYALDANVRGRLSSNPPINSYIVARLWNVEAGTVLPQSERLVYQIINLNPSDPTAGGNATAPISELITVGGPTDIQLQAADVNAVGGVAAVAQIYSDGNGYTSLRFVELG